jgi:hypothetical protein
LIQEAPGADDRFAETSLQQLTWRKLGQVFGDMNTAGLQLQHFHGFSFFARAKDETDRLLLPFLALVAVKPTEIKLHLAAPVLDAAHLGIELALERLLERDEREEMGPGQLSYQ